MIAPLQSPVLFVATEVVKDIDSSYNLWNVFFKCRDAVSDGRRLENMAWRLWYREMCAARGYGAITPESASPASSDSSSSRSCCCDSEHSTGHEHKPLHSLAYHSPVSSSICSESKMHSTALRDANLCVGKRDPPPPRSGRSIGQIICHILPQKVVAPSFPASIDKHLRALAVRLPSASPASAAMYPNPVQGNPSRHPTPPATPTSPPTTVLPQQHASPLPPATQQLAPVSSTPPTAEPPASRPLATSCTKTSTQPCSISPIKKANDATLKATDRRFFLQSPDDHHCSPVQMGKSPPARTERSSSTSGSGSSRPGQCPHGVKTHPSFRKGKEVLRAARFATIMPRRRSSERYHARPSFKIGSASSTGSRSTTGTTDGPKANAILLVATKTHISQASSRTSALATTTTASSSGSSRMAQNQVAPAVSAVVYDRNATGPVPEAKPAAQRRRQIVVANTSSEYETTDEDTHWLSEDDDEHDEDEGFRRLGGGVRDGVVRLHEAALEAQRQRELFAKIPKRSYSNLGRTQSVGLLSALLNPDPTMFPPNHPYRTSQSSHDLQKLRQVGRPPTQLQNTKTSVAQPLTAQMTNVSAEATHVKADEQSRGHYRSKRRPQDGEMEDDCESGGDENRIQISHSVAQQRLAALTGRRSSDLGPMTTTLPLPPQRPMLATVATAPIPFTHPYNLPAPAAPSTPRTTRRQMLSTELSESLRRNLLWARQVSKTSMMGGSRRPAAGTGIIGGLRPLTAMHDPRDGAQPNGRGPPHQPPQRHDERAPSENDSRTQRKRAAMARNRSWADDFHIAGW